MGSTTDLDNPFIGWLLAELDKRQWTKEELARKADITSSAISHIVNRNKPMGVDVARAIAGALNVSQITVFRLAGLLDDIDVETLSENEASRQIADLMAGVPPADRKRYFEYFRAIIEADRKRQSDGGRNSDPGRTKKPPTVPHSSAGSDD